MNVYHIDVNPEYVKPWRTQSLEFGRSKAEKRAG